LKIKKTYYAFVLKFKSVLFMSQWCSMYRRYTCFSISLLCNTLCIVRHIIWIFITKKKCQIMKLPRSNMHGRKRLFTEKNVDIHKPQTTSIYDKRIRRETTRNRSRIRRSCKNTKRLKDKLLCSVYGDIRLPYTTVYHRVCRIRSP